MSVLQYTPLMNEHMEIQGTHLGSLETRRPKESKCSFNGLVQDCSNYIVDALELLQACTKPSIWHHQQTGIPLQVWEEKKPNNYNRKH